MFYKAFGYFLILSLFSGLFASDEIAQKCLLQSYPHTIKALENHQVIFYNQKIYPWRIHSEMTDYQILLNAPDFASSFNYPYPLDSFNKYFYEDSSRIRDTRLFKAVYGDSKQAVEKNLKEFVWVDGNIFSFNIQNGAYEALLRVINKLQNLPQDMQVYLQNIGGTYKWRNIAGSSQLSPHSFGIALDINVAHSSYWLWDKQSKREQTNKQANSIPQTIVEIFESEGFIWGGRWWHYDTMHFEYRPEILCYALEEHKNK